MKFCTICGQPIQDAALRCRHCKNWLVPMDTAAITSPAVPSYVPTSISGMAIASLVLGILWIYWIGSIAALILGYLALRDIRQNPQRFDGKGLAIAGIVLGWVGVATLLFAIGIGVFIWRQETQPPQRDIPTQESSLRGAIQSSRVAAISAPQTSTSYFARASPATTAASFSSISFQPSN